MTKYYIPYFQKYAIPNSLLIMDNFSAHSTNETIEAFEGNNIKYTYLAPNTTPITQPVDIQIGRCIKANIKKMFEDWLLENEEEMIYFDKTKKEHKFKSPTRDLLLKLVI